MQCSGEGFKDKECMVPVKGYNTPCIDCPTKEKAQLFINEPESQKKIKRALDEIEILNCAGIYVP